MPAAFDWLGVGDVALERADGRSAVRSVGGAAARLTAHAAILGLKAALVGKTGDDTAGRTVRAALARAGVDLRFAPVAPGQRTSVWRESLGAPDPRRLERGCDLLLRLDEIPPPSIVHAQLTVVSGYSLSIEPARSAALGALYGALEHGGRGALQVEADLLWSANARTARRVLEPALAAARWVALTAADAAILFGPRLAPAEAVAAVGRLGPVLVYLAAADGGVVLLDRDRAIRVAPPGHALPVDRFAGPAAFFRGVLGGARPKQAALAALAYAQSGRHPAGRARAHHAARV